MYQNYFGLSETPFSIAPDPRYLYLSRRHEEALAHLLYGINAGGGFVLLTGEVGAGKTTVCRCLLQQIPATCDLAYVFNPKLTVEELLSTICVEFRIACPPGNHSIKVYVDCINAYLLDAHARGRQTVLIIDEAQRLSADVLEQMRLLTNLETDQRKLLQIILIGQPELAAMLDRPELLQLSQRIVASFHLGPLTKPEVGAYVKHRLELSGAKRQLIPASLMGRVYRLSGGVPRVINVLCDRALLGAYTQGKEQVDAATLSQAAREALRRPGAQRRSMPRALAAGLVLTAGVALAVTVYQRDPIDGKTASVPRVAAIPAARETQPSKKTEAVWPAAQSPDMLAWPADQPLSRSKAAAYTALFRQWNADYQGADACQEAERLGLRCRAARGGLDELRQFNRPAVLQLRDDRGQEFHATLTALEGDSATFAVGGKTQAISLGALAAQWTGHYTLLWRLPQDVHDFIRQGARGPAVAWLSRQLAQAQGRAVDAGKDLLFDEVLVRQVKQFQLARGLVPDGAVGPQTVIRLAGVGDQSAPRLLRKPAER
jgi:general secretion pathway protein A